MSVAIVRFGGSNCDRDTRRALEYLAVDNEIVWHEDGLADDAAGVILPGGFSYGDYLRAGAMAARDPVMEQVEEIAESGNPVLGVCNGAQIGAEAGLVPGAFTVNASARFQCERIHVRVENADTPFTSAYEEGEVLTLSIAHGEGRYEASDDVIDQLTGEDRILFRYCDEAGNVTPEANPNGSRDNIAGILGVDDNVAVMMPHPERAALPELGNTDGCGVLRAFE